MEKQEDIELEAKKERPTAFQSLSEYHRLPNCELQPYLNVHLRNSDINDF